MPNTVEPFIIADHLKALFLFGILAFAANKWGQRKGFFHLPQIEAKTLPVRLTQVLAVFTIYFGITLLAVPLVAKGLMLFSKQGPFNIQEIARLQLLSLLMSFFILGAYLLSQNRGVILRMWKDSKAVPSSIFTDVKWSVFAWLLAFPTIIFFAEFSDVLIYSLCGVHHYEQAAVRFLRLALEEPSLLTVALFTILVGAPCIEEILFRGFFQSWLKTRVGTKAAITLSSLTFAFFHLAPSQGLGNISLGISLFVFALYLGFLYEKQRSLFASISLHALFNLVSALRIMLFVE